MHRIFISSVQKELAAERRALKDYIQGDPLLRRFFEVFLFEDLPASDRRSDEVYLAEVDRCAIYLGLFGRKYGFEDRSGVSPTEREFVRATERGKERLVFVIGSDDAGRDPKMLNLIRQAGEQVVRRRVRTTPELIAAVYASFVEYLERHGELRTRPFDASACQDATLDDISDKHVRWFLTQARERQYPLADSTPVADVLTHLSLLDKNRPTNAAILLFGRAPQRFLLSSEVKCMHFHGAEIRKPIPSYQVYKGTSFELVDQALDFIMSKVARGVGTRARGPQAPVEYELPRDAVAEAIVNAVAHRDYTSSASVQVMLFADRFEVWNPGQLPPELTPERLTRPHASIPRNPLLAEPLFLAHYIERAGTGTLDMIALCKEAGLKQPQFRQDGGQFVQTLWRPAPEVTPQVTTQDKHLETKALEELATCLGLSATQVTMQVAEQVAKVLRAAIEPAAREQLQKAMGLQNREHFRQTYLEPLVTGGWLDRTVPAKPTSRLQKYRLTEKGRAWVAAKKKEAKK